MRHRNTGSTLREKGDNATSIPDELSVKSVSLAQVIPTIFDFYAVCSGPLPHFCALRNI
jgi:hypothetical protein